MHTLCTHTHTHILMHTQGTEDGFHKNDNQLQPDAFAAAAKSVSGVDVTLRLQEGYDHSYYFISSFVDDHLEHHFRVLSAQ
jgi:S-formylglutathione hydrolase